MQEIQGDLASHDRRDESAQPPSLGDGTRPGGQATGAPATRPIQGADADPSSLSSPNAGTDEPSHPRILEDLDERRPGSSEGDDDDEDIFANDILDGPHTPSTSGTFGEFEFGGDFSTYSPPPSPSAPSHGRTHRGGQSMLSQIRRKYFMGLRSNRNNN